MNSIRFRLCFFAITCGLFSGTTVAQPPGDAAGRSFAFRLSTLAGEQVVIEADDKHPVTVVCFLGAECPLVRLYSPRLSVMAKEFSATGVRFVGINSNRQDTEEDIRGYLAEYNLSFPLVLDPGNVIADQYGATRTPEVFVLNKSLRVVYQGRIDDQYAPGVNRQAAAQNDLRSAIEQTLAGHPVKVAGTEPVGCMIGKMRHPTAPSTTPLAENAVTYCNQVSRVLQKHCIECHRTGEIGPFSLEAFEDVVGWADTSQEVIDNGRMPPWHADPAHGSFANARQMPEHDKQVIRDWIAAGLPKGEESQLPGGVQFADGWQIGKKPDLEVSMREQPFRIPAEGTVEYQYFVIDPGFTEEKWVSAAQVIPGNRAVVHHAIVFIRPPDDQEFRGVGWLTAYVPGQRMIPMPAGHARRVPAGSRFVFQMHYTTNGTEQQDLSKVGIVFADPKTVTDEVITLIGIDQEFEIPPHAAAHEVSGKIRWLPEHGKLLAIAPHMHVRGKSFELFAEKSGDAETLLKVPQYDFNWQHSYVLEKPLPLHSVGKLTFKTTFDNSAANPFNPDPAQWVNWGDQTWEEMAVVFLEVSEPLQTPPAGSSTAGELAIAGDKLFATDAAAREAKITAFVEEFFKRLDTNGDGIVMRSEAPVAVRTRFGHYDLNDDQAADKSEIRQLAERRF